MAKFVVLDEFGGPEVLHLIEVPDPEPGPGQVRIRVRAAGVQPADCATRRGDFARYRPLEFPIHLGNEVAGTIDRVGTGVTGFRAGDEVIAFHTLRGYADLVVVPADQVSRKPEKMSWAQAGVLSASGQTASTALDALDVGPADTLLLHAAAGGVGSYAVRLATARGARVIGTASERNHDYLRFLGATPVTYGDGLADRVRAAAPQGITCALDAIGGAALDVSLELLGRPDRIVTIADWARTARLGIRRVGTQRSAQRLDGLIALWSQGRLHIEVAATVPLAEAAAAHRLVETGHVRGKVALLVE